MRINRIIFLAGLVLLGVTSANADIGPKLIERWTAYDNSSAAVVDHTVWDRILKAYTLPAPSGEHAGLTLFDYAAVSAADKAALEGYLAALSAVKVSALSRAEQRAFWINAYNAITVNLILDEWPVKSIRHIDKHFIAALGGPWDREIFPVEGEILSLNDIEHGILRPIWNDPRTHYGVNCASIGCPNLQADAFTAGNMEDLLDKAAADYINSNRGVIAVKKGKVRVSSIYSWFSGDFGSNDAEIIAHLRRYAKGETKTALETATRIGGHDYDWSINAPEPSSR